MSLLGLLLCHHVSVLLESPESIHNIVEATEITKCLGKLEEHFSAGPPMHLQCIKPPSWGSRMKLLTSITTGLESHAFSCVVATAYAHENTQDVWSSGPKFFGLMHCTRSLLT